MKLSTILPAALVATSASAAFDKWQPWGKRDHPCINIYQGIPENSTIAPGAEITLRFNRASTTHCSDPLAQYAGSPYSAWLYNNPRRNLDTIQHDARLKVKGDVQESDGETVITIPADAELPDVGDETVWYLRVDSSLSDAPQMPTIFNAAGPFTIRA